MIRGKAADGMYWGGIIVLVTCVIGIFFLAGMNKDTPAEIVMVITTLIGFLFGTHVAPSRKLNDKTTKLDDPIVIEETETEHGEQ